MTSKNLSDVSRRSFLQFSAVASTAAALRIATEPLLAHAAAPPHPKNAVMINANENPLGPSAAARNAVTAIAPMGGRYSFPLTDELVATFAQMNDLKPDYIHPYAGSSEPLHFTVLAFTSPTRSYVTADPGYEAGMEAARIAGARVVKVPLTKTYSHDVRAMLAAAPDAGVFYICTPNNPTGTLTSHSDVEYVLENKPKGSIVLVDEAYIHFADAPSCIDLAKAGKDLIVLRTFSKIYGMAGLRCGFAIARPDLLEKLVSFVGWNAMPITAVAAAKASLVDPALVPERRRINTANREKTFQWLDSHNYRYIPSHSNCFLLNTGRSGQEVIDAMAQQDVVIGRIWPVMPTWVRVTVGTSDEMQAFQSAFQNVMNGKVVAGGGHSASNRRFIDGLVLPA